MAWQDGRLVVDNLIDMPNLIVQRVVVYAVTIALAVYGYLYAVNRLMLLPRPVASAQISTYLPPVVQLASAFGDRYLAANIGVFRTFMVESSQFNPETNLIISRLLRDAADFNGGHADNYYTAAAVLPDMGFLSAAQYVLEKTQIARPQDSLPLYFYAFNQLYFDGDPIKASNTLFSGAARLNDMSDRLTLQAMATRWVGRVDWNEAIVIIQHMQKNTRSPELKQYMDKRITRLQNYLLIKDAVLRWKRERGNFPNDIDALVLRGYLSDVPRDPFDQSYYIDDFGQPTIRNPKPDQR